MSNAGKLAFTTTTNATYANEFDLDYDVDDEMKVKTTVDWANKSTADIIGDLVTFIKLAKSKNLNPKFAYVNLDEFYKICSADQIVKACASFAANALGISQTPDLTQVNAMLAKQAWLNGIQLRVIAINPRAAEFGRRAVPAFLHRIRHRYYRYLISHLQKRLHMLPCTTTASDQTDSQLFHGSCKGSHPRQNERIGLLQGLRLPGYGNLHVQRPEGTGERI